MLVAKIKNSFICSNCGQVTAKWIGCCPSCNEWNTFEENAEPSHKFAQTTKHSRVITMTDLSDIKTLSTQRMLAHVKEWDRVTGGGIMPGSFLLLTGDPGIGKSTLLLQIAARIAQEYKVFYFSSEESLEQVKLRAERLGCLHQNLLFSDHAQLDDIITTARDQRPDLLIIDSIQNCYTSEAQLLPGSVGQLKETAFALIRNSKEHGIATLVSGHITKDGSIAGPKMLEHMVDAVFYLQGEDRWQTRVLRSIKNRFGTVNELGFFEMREHGLQEVPNINQHLLEEASSRPGSVLTSVMEGTRPLLLELQALTITTKYGVPQRVVTGMEHNQIVLIAAILEKYLHVKLSTQDIFFKISGGFKVKGNATDLGIALALLSSFFQQPLPEKCIALGEISLTGQIKPINHFGLHAGEAAKFGIKKIFLARNQKVDSSACSLHKLATVGDLMALFE